MPVATGTIIIYRALTVKGHIIVDYFAARKVRAIEQVYSGFEHVPAAFLSLFGSTKRGKAIVEL